jgi:DNA transformation protein
MTERLETIVNIGPKLAAGLRAVGITDLDQLRAEGAVSAWERLREADEFDCASSLLALEGAIQGIRWHHLPAERRADLTAYVHGVKK